MVAGTLIVSSSKQTANTLSDLLRPAVEGPVLCIASGAEARRRVGDTDVDLILVNTPLSDEFGEALALALTQKTLASAILVVKAELVDEVSAKVEEHGVMVLPKPISRGMLFQTVKLAGVARRQLQQMRQENARLQNRIEELRLVDRAKCALIQYRDMTEPQAHRFIEQEAMDRRLTRREVAREIIRNFEG